MEFRYKGQALGGTAALSPGMAVYSEEETVVGTYNGKPVYRLVINATLPDVVNQTVSLYDVTNLHIDALLGIMPVLNDSAFGDFYEGTDRVRFYLTSDDLWVVMRSSAYFGDKVRIILEYTKTTDPEGTVTPLPANYVQDYDTEDGWHVRKYSDGYVEMSRTDSLTCSADTDFTQNTSWHELIQTKAKIPNNTYPIPLVALYNYSATQRGAGYGFWPGDATTYSGSNQEDRLTETAPCVFVSQIAKLSNFTYPFVLNLYISVTGRWK